jgi:SAM-dependent methyltransferase
MRDGGAPVALYRLLEAGDEPDLICREIPADVEILELGSGSGRITHPLVARGRRVVAVDYNPEMLALIDGAQTVLSRIEDLDLHRTFRGVLLMSNLVNTRDDERRIALLRACARHLAPNGLCLIERYDPESGVDPEPVEKHAFGLTIRTFDIRRDGNLLFETIEYDAGTRGRWQVRLEGARILSDDEMLAALAAVRLRLVRWLDEHHRWLAAAKA